MNFDKVTIIIPNVKRVATEEVKYSGGVAQFTTKAGKSLGIPVENVLFQDEKCIIFKDPRRKIVKGSFSAKDGFLVDSSGCRVNSSIVTFSEKPAKKTKAQAKADAKRGKAMAAARKKGGTIRKAAKSSPGKLKIKFKK